MNDLDKILLYEQYQFLMSIYSMFLNDIHYYEFGTYKKIQETAAKIRNQLMSFDFPEIIKFDDIERKETEDNSH